MTLPGSPLNSSAILICGLLCVGCAAEQALQPLPPLAPATFQAEMPPPKPAPVVVSDTVPQEQMLRKEPPRPTLQEDVITAKGPQAVIANANEFARQKPALDHYFNAIQRYTYQDGTLYQIYTLPGRATSLELSPDETINDFPMGDPDKERWTLGLTFVGDGKTKRDVVVARPNRYNLITNMTIFTTKRFYAVELISPPKPPKGSDYENSYMVAVSWTYPELEAQREREARERQRARRYGAAADDYPCTHYRYHIVAVSKALPVWMPVMACDDETHVMIHMPPTFRTAEAPTLYLEASDGSAQMTNYRLLDTVYIVDRLFQVAELRLGGTDKEAEVVRILRVKE